MTVLCATGVMAQEIKIETAPFDARFPNVNQTRHCWQHYVDFHKCESVKGEGAQVCQYFQKVYRSMCPVAWVNKLVIFPCLLIPLRHRFKATLFNNYEASGRFFWRLK